MRKPFSWKSVTIYLTIILFLLLVIQFADWNKRGEKEVQYLTEIETAYESLLSFQKLVMNGEVEVDANKEVLAMSEKNFQYQLSMYIDIFGNQSEGEQSLYDYYVQIDKLLTKFYEASTVEGQKQVHEELTTIQQRFVAFLEQLK